MDTINRETIRIQAANFKYAEFSIKGKAPLVIHRFSAKTKNEMKFKMETGKSASSKKNRDPKNTDDSYNESRYISKEGWDGFHAGAIRAAMWLRPQNQKIRHFITSLNGMTEKRLKSTD